MKRKFLAVMISLSMLVPQGQMIIANAAETSTSALVQSEAAQAFANVVVDGSMKGNSGDSVEGIKTVKTVKEALDLVPSNNASEFVIYIKNGTYKEKLSINTPNVTLVGESNTGVVLTYDDAAGTIKRAEDGGDGVSTYGTGGSASINIGGKAKNFSAVNLTMENSFDEANTTIKSKQAVAMMSTADMTTFVNCRFIGNQDTLCPYSNRQYFKNCYIEGDVDFIFGNAMAVFEGCELHSVDRQGINPKGYVTAPNTSASSEYGYLFENCKLTSDISEAGTVYLGRPWHDNGTRNSEAVFKNCELGAHIKAEGWSTMEGRDAAGNKETEYPKDNRMFEYGNTGAGAVSESTENRKILSEEEAAKYTRANVLNNWDADAVAEKLEAYAAKTENSSSAQKPQKENEAEKVKWTGTRFGLTTFEDQNTISVDDKNKTVTLTSGQKDGSRTGGKVTGSNDGMTYYYTEINPDQNFELSADVRVDYFEKENPDNQCGFGIMARDTIGVANDDSIAPSNMVLVGGYKGNVQSVMRYGVTPDNSSKIVMENAHQFSGRPANDGTATYKLSLKKTNTGYIASVDNGEEVIYYRPEGLEVMDSNKIYLGFFTARVAGITVSNVNLTTSKESEDAPRVDAPVKVVNPEATVLSTKNSGTEDYKLSAKTNVNGNLVIDQDGKEIFNGKVSEEGVIDVDTKLVKGKNNFNLKYTSEDGKVSENPLAVTYKTIGTENGEIYVSQEGTENGDGTVESPLDIYTALKYTGKGQTVKVKGGTYNLDKPVTIEMGNNGTKDVMKTLTSYDGNAVFDFGTKSSGLTLKGDYWHVKGIEVCNTVNKSQGFVVGGNNNIIEDVKTYKNGDTGLQISGDQSLTIDRWPSNNLILNCESYDNKDKAMNNADGFAAKISVGEGNIFRGCIAHNNCDDGWDLFSKLEIGKIGAVLIEDCVAYENGTLTDGTVTKGDGNGFKLGGEGIIVYHKLKDSLSFHNDAVGILGNQNPACIVENSISVDNDINVKLDYYTNVKPQYGMSNIISFRTEEGSEDLIPNEVLNENNYFSNGTETANLKGEKLTADDFKSTVAPTSFERDENGKIIRGDYMALKDKAEEKPQDPADQNKPSEDNKGEVSDTPSEDNKGEVSDAPSENSKTEESTTPAEDNKADTNEDVNSSTNTSNTTKKSTSNKKGNSAKTGDAGAMATAALAGMSLLGAVGFKRKRK
ncbi:Pectin methylesterase [Clostridium sp. DSM 8431]|uniref:pectinesterase family protein n=1 Tax=Clostridium sp. DSM 8431 TaxID=1761781 RepID=UPI0008E777B4|nr:pectinesterase family protein [Clostridium sp. DSM 8431]SFU44918.1 Pectin methylesterase [Clostridium sp. DSM 8431]